MLHCVHKIPFSAVEDDYSEEQGHHKEDKAIEKATPAEGTAAHAAVFESLENGGQGVEFEDGANCAAGGAHGVDDGGGVHEELHTEGDQLLEVSVFGGKCGDNKSP